MGAEERSEGNEYEYFLKGNEGADLFIPENKLYEYFADLAEYRQNKIMNILNGYK